VDDDIGKLKSFKVDVLFSKVLSLSLIFSLRLRAGKISYTEGSFAKETLELTDSEGRVCDEEYK
jgi:hypothetical protein